MCLSDYTILFTTRCIRMISFGALSQVIYLHLTSIGFSASDVGLLFTGALLGDLLMTFPLTTRADSLGRKKTLVASAFLKIGAGLAFTLTTNFIYLLLASIIGVITPTGNEIGPFMAIEQAALTATLKGKVDEGSVTRYFSYYNFAGYLALAVGSFGAGEVIATWPDRGYNLMFLFYAVTGGLMCILYAFLSEEIEAKENNKATNQLAVAPSESDKEQGSTENGEQISSDSCLSRSGSALLRISGLKSHQSLKTVSMISSLFVIDAFAGGFVMQTIIVAWFAKRYKLSPEWLGGILSGVNIIAGLSALAVNPLAARIGSLRTAVFTHLPSNILLIMVPFMPDTNSAIAMLLLRSSLSQMDVPARQAFVAMAVEANERSAAGGITNIVRSLGVILPPLLWGPLLSSDPESLDFKMPFIIAGVLKVIYDLLLFISFRSFTPPEQTYKQVSQTES